MPHRRACGRSIAPVNTLAGTLACRRAEDALIWLQGAYRH